MVTELQRTEVSLHDISQQITDTVKIVDVELLNDLTGLVSREKTFTEEACHHVDALLAGTPETGLHDRCRQLQGMLSQTIARHQQVFEEIASFQPHIQHDLDRQIVVYHKVATQLEAGISGAGRTSTEPENIGGCRG